MRCSLLQSGGATSTLATMAKTASVSEVRAWAKEQGFQLGDRGRLPAEVWSAWEGRSAARSLPKPRATQPERESAKSQELRAANARIATLENVVADLSARLAAVEGRVDEPRKLFARQR